jgi:hypothetical protein
MDVFRKIYTDVDKATLQYGRMESHDNEEARSRYIASVSCPSYLVSHIFEFDTKYLQFFPEIVCLFGSAVINKPEGLLDSEFTKRGRIEHHFYAMDSVSIVFIEVKKSCALGKGKLDVIAQILAESAGMSDFPFYIAALDFNDIANNISLRLCKLEVSTLGAYSCDPLRWREVRVLSLRLWHEIRLLVWNGLTRVGLKQQASPLSAVVKRK